MVRNGEELAKAELIPIANEVQAKLHQPAESTVRLGFGVKRVAKEFPKVPHCHLTGPNLKGMKEMQMLWRPLMTLLLTACSELVWTEGWGSIT